LIVLANAIVHPWTVMVHFSYASLADGAVMCSIWLDTAAFRALVKHLSLAIAHLLNHLFGSVTTRHSTLQENRNMKLMNELEWIKVTYRIREHGAQM